MRKSVLILLCVAVLGCLKEETAPSDPAGPNTTATTTGAATDAKDARVDTVIQPAPVFFDKAILSTKVDAQGNAVADEPSIPKGSTAFFTMYIRESPVGLHTRVVWMDADRKEVAKEAHDMQGAKVVTYKLDTKKLKAGKYVVQGYWGGNLAVEREFEIAAPAPPAPKATKKM